MKVVYLDQNKWIDLARVEHGVTSDSDFVRTLEACLAAAEEGRAVFPLSAMHYMETWRSGSARRRDDLGGTMWRLSGGRTVASYRELLLHELRTSLAGRFPGPKPPAFEYVGRGVSHAFGMDIAPFRLDPAIRGRLPASQVAVIERAGRVAQEQVAISGVSPLLPDMARFGPTEHGERFQQHLLDLPTTLSSLPSEKREDALYPIALADIMEPLTVALAERDLDLRDLVSLGNEAVREFVDSVPSRRVEVHLLRQVLKNPSLRPKLSDLEDWAGLGPAAAHADVLVCEKHFASLIARDGFQTHATVETDVRSLLDHLSMNVAP